MVDLGWPVALHEFLRSAAARRLARSAAAARSTCDVRRVAFEKFPIDNIPEAYDGRMCILRGKSPRGDFGHVVVARFVGSCDTSLHKMMLTDAGAFRLVHDPHPSSEFLDEGEACAWAMFFSEQN